MNHWKETVMKKNLGILGCLLLVGGLDAQIVIEGIDAGASGSDGTFQPTSDHTVDLSEAVSTDWNLGSTDPGNGLGGSGVYDNDKWAVVFKYESVHIPPGVTVRFANHPSRAPVVWLVEGDVLIEGTIDLSGRREGPNGTWLPGPGGFRGSFQDGFGYLGRAGFGPGGGGWTEYGHFGQGVRSYGNPQLLPLIGGSGAGTGNSAVGGAGGGAILIAAQGSVTLGASGTIYARDADVNEPAWYDGSGGAVRVIGDQISGAGRIDVRPTRWPDYGSLGRIRLEANNYNGDLETFPPTSVVNPENAPLIWPPSDSPVVRLLSINGRTIPNELISDLRPGYEDISIQETGASIIRLETENVPLDWAMRLRIVPTLSGLNPIVIDGDAASNAAITIESGDADRAIWQVETILPAGTSMAIQARAYKP